MLGKRKRATRVVRRESKESDLGSVEHANDGTQDVFRKYFEARFDPLAQPEIVTTSLGGDSSDDDSNEEIIEDGPSDHEFDGFSDVDDGEEEHVVSVIEVADASKYQAEEYNSIDKIFKKSFMSSKPPRETDQSAQSKTSDIKSSGKDDEDDVTNLKHDLDLQKLLRESHLLSQSIKSSTSPSRTTTTLHGKQRHQATDLRLLELGSKSSVYNQDKMPMSHRKGIKLKNIGAEERRRKDAKENGVILEKAKTKKAPRSSTRRERGVDVPVLGKFRGGTLALSKRDVASIQGPSGRPSKRKGKR